MSPRLEDREDFYTTPYNIIERLLSAMIKHVIYKLIPLFY